MTFARSDATDFRSWPLPLAQVDRKRTVTAGSCVCGICWESNPPWLRSLDVSTRSMRIGLRVVTILEVQRGYTCANSRGIPRFAVGDFGFTRILD